MKTLLITVIILSQLIVPMGVFAGGVNNVATETQTQTQTQTLRDKCNSNVTEYKTLISGILENPHSLSDEELVLLAKHKIKPTNMTPKDVIDIRESDSGSTVFLESGNRNSGGWTHIKYGPNDDHFQHMRSAFFNGDSNMTDKKISEWFMGYAAKVHQSGVEYSGDITVPESATKKLHIEIGDNGFFVTAYPN